MAELKPGWRIELSNQKEKRLVVNANTEERARELALLWAKDEAKDPTAVIISCKLMAENEIFIAEGNMWMSEEKG
jgi:hypothetical protein